MPFSHIFFNIYLLFSWPLDRHTVKAYFLYFSLNALYQNVYFFSAPVFFQFFTGTCFYLTAFCQDFDQSLHTINNYKKNKMDFNEKLRTIIQFHLNILEWVFLHKITTKMRKSAERLIMCDIFSYYDRMADILNGYLFSHVVGGTLVLAVCTQQLVSVSCFLLILHGKFLTILYYSLAVKLVSRSLCAEWMRCVDYF